MIAERVSKGYIGGSDMGLVYGSYSTMSFKKIWNEKLMGIKAYDLKGKSIDAGNILEHEILDHAEVDQKYRINQVTKISVPDSCVGVNMDANDTDQRIVHEAKTGKLIAVDGMVSTGGKWVLQYALGVGYRRQVFHACWITGYEEALIHLMPLTDEEIENPFQVNVADKMITVTMKPWEEFNYIEHEIRLHYLNECMNLNIQPDNLEIKNRLLIRREKFSGIARKFFRDRQIYTPELAKQKWT